MRGRKMSAGNGSPFSDEELERIRLHEAAHDQRNGVPGSVAIDVGSLVFAYAKRNTVASWESLLETAIAIEKFNRQHAAHHPAFHAFPRTSGDVERIIAWRARNPRSALPNGRLTRDPAGGSDARWR